MAYLLVRGRRGEERLKVSSAFRASSHCWNRAVFCNPAAADHKKNDNRALQLLCFPPQVAALISDASIVFRFMRAPNRQQHLGNMAHKRNKVLKERMLIQSLSRPRLVLRGVRIPRSVMQNYIEQRFMYPDAAAAVLDKAKLAEAIHEEADTGPGGAYHSRQSFLGDLWN
jgi:hypothetical protein